MPPGSVLRYNFIKHGSENRISVFLPGFLYEMFPIYFLYIPYIGVFAEIGGLKLSFPWAGPMAAPTPPTIHGGMEGAIVRRSAGGALNTDRYIKKKNGECN